MVELFKDTDRLYAVTQGVIELRFPPHQPHGADARSPMQSTCIRSAASPDARGNFVGVRHGGKREESQDAKERQARVYLARARTSIKPSHAAFQPQTKSHPLIPLYTKSPILQGARRSCVMPNILDESHRVKRGTLLLRRRISLALAPRPAPPNRPIRRCRNSSTAESRHQASQTMGFFQGLIS